MKNIYVSQFNGFKNPKPIRTVSLLEYLKNDSQKEIVELIRTLTDKSEINKWKARLPCITVSGQFETRNINNLIAHSGYICIDIDADDNPSITDFCVLRNELKKIKNIAYISLSVSGKGVFCVIPIQETENHKAHFEALKEIFKTLGITIDKACGDITRLRCCSYDTDDFYNENAEVFIQKYYPEIEKKTRKNNIVNKNHEIRISSLNNPQKNHTKVLSKIYQLIDRDIDITETYHDWLQITSALANEFGEKGRDLFHLISHISPKYKESETNKMFDKFLGTSYGYNIGTFFHLANKALKN